MTATEATAEIVAAIDPTPEQAAYAADQLREILTLLGPGRVSFYRDCTSIWHDAGSRNEIRARIARLDEIAGRRLPLIDDQEAQEWKHCGRGPCSDRAGHDGDCDR
ncbi:hypothetical protein [Nocardioides sp. InS609-2]|uniref:hypothetical protein n=1 Tax=Nocardioides sp. InS609-2 TaxID=2760705 RepID=UPI0020C151C1|nr:hypothetical protein [Nocardioides sp. InS609-2]